jgi:hypothetical protein
MHLGPVELRVRGAPGPRCAGSAVRGSKRPSEPRRQGTGGPTYRSTSAPRRGSPDVPRSSGAKAPRNEWTGESRVLGPEEPRAGRPGVPRCRGAESELHPSDGRYSASPCLPHGRCGAGQGSAPDAHRSRGTHWTSIPPINPIDTGQEVRSTSVLRAIGTLVHGSGRTEDLRYRGAAGRWFPGTSELQALGSSVSRGRRSEVPQNRRASVPQSRCSAGPQCQRPAEPKAVSPDVPGSCGPGVPRDRGTRVSTVLGSEEPRRGRPGVPRGSGAEGQEYRSTRVPREQLERLLNNSMRTTRARVG